MEQNLIVGVIVAAALVYMILRLRKNSRGKGCSCGCEDSHKDCCKGDQNKP